MTVLSDARELFAGNGLPFPPVPETLAPRIRHPSEWWFTTLDDGSPLPYDLGENVEAFVSGGSEDSFVLAHAGHGASSWAIHCYVTLGPLGIFVQSAWGAATASESRDLEERAVMATRFEAMSRLLGHVTEACMLVGAPGPDRCAVVVSDFHPSRWARFASGSEPAWHRTHDPLEEVLAACAEISNP